MLESPVESEDAGRIRKKFEQLALTHHTAVFARNLRALVHHHEREG